MVKLRRIRRTRRRLLAEDVDRATRWVQTVVIAAHHTDAIVPEAVDASVVVLRVWADYMDRWADQTPPPEAGVIE